MIQRRPCPWAAGRPPCGVIPQRIVVCGTRTFDDFEFAFEKLDRLTLRFDLPEVIVGSEGTRVERGGEWVKIGGDRAGFVWAEMNWYTRLVVHADWETHGKAAGPIRNKEMAELAAMDNRNNQSGYCVAFWDGKSKGTENMIKMFLRYNDPKRLKVYNYGRRR